MTKPLKTERTTFVLRVWAEFLKQEPPQFRGEIKNVENNRQKYFSKIKDIQDFIEENINQANQDVQNTKTSNKRSGR